MDFGEGALREIRSFHEFLEGWLTGRDPRDEAGMRMRLEAFHLDFVYVTPSARLRRSEDLRQWFAHGHGSDPGVRITIENADIRYCDATFVLATYEEHQHSPREATKRLSSAVFLPAQSAPHGVAWFHLHEVFITGEGSRQ